MSLSVVEVVSLLKALAPEAQSAVGALVRALHSKSEDDVRKAVEATLRLQFAARNEVGKK
jgi:hypothetical protein